MLCLPAVTGTALSYAMFIHNLLFITLNRAHTHTHTVRGYNADEGTESSNATTEVEIANVDVVTLLYLIYEALAYFYILLKLDCYIVYRLEYDRHLYCFFPVFS